MPVRTRFLAIFVTAALVAAFGGIAGASDRVDGVHEQQRPGVKSPNDGIVDTPLEVHGLHEQQHGSTSGHVPGSSLNVDLVGKLRLPRTKSNPGIITDVWSHGNYAYLGTFAPPCAALGVNVVDISDPTNPAKVNFIPSRPASRVNDVKVFHFDGLASGFSGDLLLHSNENCSGNPQRVGGISIYDVSDPLDPVRMAVGVGDTNGGALARARQVHNVYAWQDGDRAYAALVDDEELLDVDILDITDPANPVHITETGLPDWPAATVDAFGDDAFVHDLWAKDLGGTWTLLLSYWDAGWILLDVSNPMSPAFLGDSDYPDPDPLVLARLGLSLEPEGNAHAGVWSADGQFLLVGDEDFSPYRLEFAVTSGPATGTYPAGEFGWTVPIADLPDGTLNGPTVFGGYGCPDDRGDIPSAPSTAPGEEATIVFERGPVDDPNHPHDACFFSEKVESGQLAGYDAVIIANHHVGSGAGAQPDAFVCGSQGHAFTVTAHGLCTGHRLMHLMFDRTPDYTVPYPLNDPGDKEPDIGDIGPTIEVTSFFDGWGPLHLLNANTLAEIDAWAPSEVYDEAFASGAGDLTMHNVETDPSANRAYISWYSLGLQIVEFDGSGITPVGHYIDPKGNNFWGVHVADDHPTEDGLILASDRDHGLWIFRYTGP